MICNTLPDPDVFGTYWLAERPQGPAIFTSKNIANGKVVSARKFFASDGEDGAGVLMCESGICYYSSPQEALDALISHRLRAVKLAGFTFRN